MKYIDEFRDGVLAKKFAAYIAREVNPHRHYHLMEFCGGHTHAISRYGIPDLLPQQAIGGQPLQGAHQGMLGVARVDRDDHRFAAGDEPARLPGLRVERRDAAGGWSLRTWRKEPSSPASEPWLLLHGLGANAATWLPTLGLLAHDDLLVPELSAQGGTRGPRPALGVRDAAADPPLAGALRGQALQRPDLPPPGGLGDEGHVGLPAPEPHARAPPAARVRRPLRLARVAVPAKRLPLPAARAQLLRRPRRSLSPRGSRPAAAGRVIPSPRRTRRTRGSAPRRPSRRGPGAGRCRGSPSSVRSVVET